MAEVFDKPTIECLQSSYLIALEAIASAPDSSPFDINILSAADLGDVTRVSCGAVQQRYYAEPLFHEGFDAHARAAGAAPCLTFQGRTMSYAEVEARATALAQRLVVLGVGRNTAVGMMLDRSFELVITMLAILKAGGGWPASWLQSAAGRALCAAHILP